MSFRQACVLALTTAACGSVATNAAGTATPVCGSKAHPSKTSTKASPCVKAVAATPKVVAPVAPNAKPVSQSQLVTQVADPGDTGGRIGATDADTVVHFLDPARGLYQIEVFNTSGIGYINTFDWVPPPNMTVTAITSTQGGRCSINGSGSITCSAGGKGIAPPKCTCLAGGELVVNFTATGNAPTFNGQYWTYYGIVGDWTHITSMTPVPYHIPSFLTPGVELPVCGTPAHPSTKSTGTDPCTTSP